jgi:hypothetical protein
MPLLPNPDSPDEFEYDGWLSFYPFQTDVRGDFSEYGSHSDIRDIINNNLPSYRQGTPEDPGNGFEALMTPDLIRDANLIDRYPHLESLHHIKYIQEEYQQMMVYNEESDDFEERSTVEIASSDIFWSFPNYLFGRGSKKDIKEIHHRLRSSLVNSLRIERFAFKPEFLVWIIYKFYEVR